MFISAQFSRDGDRGGGVSHFFLDLVGCVRRMVGAPLLSWDCSFLLGLDRKSFWLLCLVLCCALCFGLRVLQELAALQDETELKASAAREGLAAADAQTVAAAEESNRLR